MKRPMKQFLFWSPRILTVLFALFLSHFAVDVSCVSSEHAI